MRISRKVLGAAAVAAVASSLSFAAWAEAAGGGGGEAANKGSEFLLIGQVVVLVIVAQLLGELMTRLRQPAVMGQLLAGILLGPSVLGALLPGVHDALFPNNPMQKAMLDGIAQFGILMLLLLAGMETDLSLVRRVRGAAASVSLTGIALPFAAGFALGEFLPDNLLPNPDQRLITSLFLGTALSISSVKIVAVVVRDMGFIRRGIGQVILASAIIDDTVGWIIIAIIFGVASQGGIDVLSIARSAGGTLIFLAASFTIGRPMVFWLIRWTNDNFKTEAALISMILIIMGSMAALTHAIGVHTVLGAFIAGILIGESPILTRQIDDNLRNITAGLFMPVFFSSAGLSSDLTVLRDPELALLTLGLIAIASIGKASGAFAGGRFAGLKLRESIALAAGMNARGSTEVIVATIGLSLGMLSQNLFTMIVAMAVLTTLAMPPSLRWALGRIPISDEEQKRLEREDFEQRGFVSNIERILVAVDGSAAGQFASRLAGLLAGSRGMPVTVLKLGDEDKTENEANDKPNGKEHPKTPNGNGNATNGDKDTDDDDGKHVKAAAEKSAPADEEKADRTTHVEVAKRVEDEGATEAVRREASKGFDLIFIGLGTMAKEDGGFIDEVSKIAAGFEGTLAPVIARGKHRQRPLISRFNILVPVSGNAVSRRGAEVAIALAKAANAPVTALSVLNVGKSATAGQRKTARREARDVLAETAKLGEHYNVRVRTVLKADVPSGDAIRQQVKKGGHDLIVMGVSRRQSEELSFGALPAALLENGDCSILFVGD